MNDSPETSRKMIRRALFGTVQTEEETRAYLQERVALLFKLMFWSLFALIAFLAASYSLDRANAPIHENTVYATAGLGLVPMAFIWRSLLVRSLSIDALYRLDLVYSFFIGLAFGFAALVQSDLRPAAYLSVVYSTFTVFARTLIIPSTWRRTLATSTLTYVPMTAAAAALALTKKLDVPGLMGFIGYLLFSVAPVILATAGSWIIYGLRQKANAAQQLGSYKIDRKIGEGGMGTVYLAHHVLLRRPTAVKLVHGAGKTPDALERFEREVQHMSQLTHPNSVAVFDYGHSLDGTFYYAMEYLGGGIDLDDLVREHGPQPSGRVASILAQVCGALHEAHLAQLIHRDIKPANIILCERGGMPDVAKVLDYGLVKDITVDTGETGQVVLGTPGYVAPETLTDPSKISVAVDICIQHVTKPVTPPSQRVAHWIAPELEALIMRCLAKTPDERFASALELRTALLALPAPGDWDPAKARHWWNDYRAQSQKLSEATDVPTRTMQIDLAAAART